MQETNLLALLAVLVLPACGPQTKKKKKAALQKAAFSLSEIQTQIDIHQKYKSLRPSSRIFLLLLVTHHFLYQLCDLTTAIADAT